MWPLLFAACTDAGLTIKTGPPSVTIVTPGPGAVFWAHAPVTLEAVGGDDTTDPADLMYAWSAGPWPLEGVARATESGSVFDVADGFPAGLYTVAVTVVDAGGESGEDSVEFEVIDDDPPVVTVVAPLDGSALAACAEVEVVVFVTDAETKDLTTLSLGWSGLPASASPPAHPDADGYARVLVTPDDGAASWGVTATDARGGVGADEVTVDGVACGVDDLCDGVDNDDDGLIDEDAPTSTWYPDADHDGHGDPLAPFEACAPPKGATATADDCDDADPAVHPGATEVCNDQDDDCDGLVDEGLATPWYPDDDGDGFGDPDRPLDACAPPEGALPTGDDCDDSEWSIHPGATEVCNVDDDDCDGSVDEDLERVYIGSPTTSEVFTYDGAGALSFVSGVGSVSALALDEAAGTLYIGQWNNPVVWRVNLDGTGLTAVYGGYGAGGQGVATTSSGALFWGEYYGDLRVGSWDGSASPVVVISRSAVSSLVGASLDGFGVGLAVDEVAGRVYAFTRSNAGLAGRWLVSARTDGSDLVALRNIESMCMALDAAAGVVYFGDVVGGVPQMWRMNVDGTGATALFDLADGVTCSGVAISPAGRLYYLQDGTGALWSANADGSGMTVEVRGLPTPQGVAVGACAP
jgi:hypothetical protein